MNSKYLLLFLTSFCLFANEKPSWINEPAKGCSSSELCVVGESAGRMMAGIEARNEMAKYFSTKVSSSSTVTTNSNSKVIDDVVSGEVFEDLVSKINETTEESLKGVEIRETFEGTESFYALAVLDKRSAAKLFKSEINSLNNKNRELYKDGRRSSYFSVLKNLKIIEGLNQRYELLTNTKVAPAISLSQVMKKKRANRALGIKVKANVKELTKSREIKGLIVKMLLGNDYLISKKEQGHDYLVKVIVEKEKQYFNVEGFVKYKFILKAKSFKGSTILGAKEYVAIQTGRSFMKAYENALPGIKKFIKDSFGELNID